MGNADTSATAAAHMRTLREISGPLARKGDTSPSRAKPAHAPAPIDLGLLDHLEASRAEIVAAVRDANPAAGPAPLDEGIYQWMVDATPQLDEDRRRVHEALAYRQGLEHALRAGEEKVIRRHACPACRTWGLFWSRPAQRAACVNRYCSDAAGRRSTWTLSQLAHHHIATQAERRRTAT
ncbi:hypothetical protein [Streptomyces sp. NPDC048516]|uniref:hypothetical protein n=1 Tax=Streptomyces sp. NPDC048516 TaxID=3365565 RepID=UPI003722165C